MGALFGTDGIRGVANRYPMNVEMAVRVGRAVARSLCRGTAGCILIGQDTRQSGAMLSHAVAAGICSAGARVLLVGVLPTPGVAVLTRKHGAAAGIVISASHNPYQDNGIKVFNSQGFKLSPELEQIIEEQVLGAASHEADANDATVPGTVATCDNASAVYGDFLKAALKDSAAAPLRGMHLVLDCANGATSALAPGLLRELGAQVDVLFAQPDGTNINASCGSEHPAALQAAVLQRRAQLGIAFDGDGDRLLAVDETGSVLSGDHLLAIFAQHAVRAQTHKGLPLVSTVMSNLGLRQALIAMGIAHVTSAVGDREVMLKMKATGALLGGEASGHILFLDGHTTGDGLYSALRLLEVLQQRAEPLSKLAAIMTRFPQVLLNVAVRCKPELEALSGVQQVIAAAEAALKGQGRVLVRYSGTQPQCRVMVEGPGEQLIEDWAQRIAREIRQAIGG